MMRFNVSRIIKFNVNDKEMMKNIKFNNENRRENYLQMQYLL